MNEESTTDLEHIVSQLKPNDLYNYIDKHCSIQSNPKLYFDYINEQGIPCSDIVRHCEGLLSKSYVYDLINAVKQNPSRDVVIILCICAKMNRKNTRRMLENYGHRDLYPKDTRDIIIATYINNNNYNLDSINNELVNYGLPILKGSAKE